MSLPDHLLDDDEEDECQGCGEHFVLRKHLCGSCLVDLADLYADAKIQDEKEGK